MHTPDQKNLLKRFFNALPPHAQGGSDVSQIYVARSQDSAHDPVATLHQHIEWSEKCGAYSFSGLRGSGKTTELNRFITECNNMGLAAFYCNAGDYLNLNDPKLALPQLLLTVLAGLTDDFKRRYGKDLLDETILQRVGRLLQKDVEVRTKLKAGVKAPVGIEAGVEFDVTLKDNPDFKKRLIEFASASGEFYAEARAFAQQAATAIRQATQKDKIVLVVDSLEGISAPSGDEQTLFDSLKELFYSDPEKLYFDAISVVYTAPPYLHAILPGVSTGFTCSLSLPNFKVMQRPQNGDCAPHQSGIDQMVEIVARRFPEWPDALAKPVLEHLAWLSGGNARRYFELIRNTLLNAALAQSDLPIAQLDAGPVLQAISKASEPLQWLNAPDRLWLERFKQHTENPSEYITDLASDLPSIIRLFDHSLVLNYQNGSVWYQVPPLVRDHV